MELDLGGQEVVADPSSDEVRHYLRYMRVESPFLTLSKDEATFIQALFTSEKEQYRVEHRTDGKQYYTHVGYEEAVLLFLCFMEESCDVATQAKWKRLYQLNPSVDSCLAWIGLVVFLLLLAFWGLYEFSSF